MRYAHCEPVIINSDGVVLRCADGDVPPDNAIGYAAWAPPLYHFTIIYNTQAHRIAQIARDRENVLGNKPGYVYYALKAWILSWL